MEHVPSDSESTKREGMLQSNDLFRLLHKYYTDIMTLQKEVKNIPKRFPRGKNITDVQCSRITDSLSKLEQPVKDFYRLLDTHKTYPPLPITVEPHRHSLLIILNSIDKNLNDLKRLINGYPAVSQRASSEVAMAQRDEILLQLADLSNNIDALDKLLKDFSKDSPDEKQNGSMVTEITTNELEDGQQQERLPLHSLLIQRAIYLPQVVISTLRHRWRLNTLHTTHTPRNDVYVPETLDSLDPSFRFDRLYKKKLKRMTEHQLKEICHTVNISYSSLDGNSPEAKALSLYEEIERRDEFIKLERALS